MAEEDKETETLNLYIEQQQNKISNLMSTIVMLETKVAYLENEIGKIDTKHADEVAFLKEDYEAEIENLKDINRVYKDELMMLSPRPALSNKKGSTGTKAKTTKITTGFDIKGEHDPRKNIKRKGLIHDILAEQTTTIGSGFDLMADNGAKVANRRKGIIHAEDAKSVKHNSDLVGKILNHVKAPVRKGITSSDATSDRVRKTTILEPKEEPVVITPVRTGLSKGSKLKRN